MGFFSSDVKTLPIICFLGPDGSGKSTIARKLKNLVLSSQPVKISWMKRHEHSSLCCRNVITQENSIDFSENVFQNIRLSARMRRNWQIIEFALIMP